MTEAENESAEVRKDPQPMKGEVKPDRIWI